MKRERSNDTEIDRLIHVSEEALNAARIEHHEVFRTAMQQREALLAQLWGFPEGVPLPPFDPALVQSQRSHLPSIDAASLKRLKELDQGILIALEAQKKRLEEDGNLVTRGSLFMKDIRSMESGRTGRRFDRTG